MKKKKEILIVIIVLKILMEIWCSEIYPKNLVEALFKSYKASGYKGEIVCSSNWLNLGYIFLILIFFF